MKRIHLNTLVSFILSSVSLILVFYEYLNHSAFDFRIFAGVFAMIAWFASASEFVKYSSSFQIAGFFLSGFGVGLSVDQFLHVFPFLTLSLFLANFAITFRLIFKRRISDLEYPLLAPVIVLPAVLSYIAGNLKFDYGWTGWVLPLPIILFSTFKTFGLLVKDKRLLSFAKKNKVGLETGKPAPPFSLPDNDNNMVHLSDYAGKRNVLLIFVRGDWCPSCHMMLRTYQRESHKFQEKNVVLFAIGPDPIGVNRDMAARLGIEYKVLSDEGQKTAIAYSVQFPQVLEGDKFSPGIPLPASFLIDKKGIVKYCSRPDKIGEFLDPRSILPVLGELN